MPVCSLCGTVAEAATLAEAAWLAPSTVARLAEEHPGWTREDGACPACAQQALLAVLLQQGENAFHTGVQARWPLDPEAAFGALPTPLRLHADPRFTGRGVTVAFVDAAFHPHPDLTLPRNRIRAWVDASGPFLVRREFGAAEIPRWPGWDAREPRQWHGLMTTAAACGAGTLSHGLYRGLAPDAELVLVQVAGGEGRIDNRRIARGLRWLRENAGRLGIGVVSVSLGGDPVPPGEEDAVEHEVAGLVTDGIVVLAAAGNDGVRRLVPPGSAAQAITVGGLDDRNVLSHEARQLWHSNYGETRGGAPKPEIVAPSLWVVAPILPGSTLAEEGSALFARRGNAGAEAALLERKLVTPSYQHVEGTSFATPIVAGIVAAMREANPGLTPRRVRELLLACAHPVPGAEAERQGAGAVDAGRAVALALGDRHSGEADFAASPRADDGGVRFLLHDHAASRVEVLGSWDGWRAPGLAASRIEEGLWEARLGPAPEGGHTYKFLLDGARWLCDPANPARRADGNGNWNSVLPDSPRNPAPPAGIGRP